MKEDYFNTLTKEIIENNDKEKAIEIIANKLNEKQLSNEKEILTNIEKGKEIERLNNIINELERYFFGQLQMYGGGGTAQEYYDKLQELKGSDNNE